jgi:UDP-N-acetylglucosamine--dolichyl-phosphate N-acetylglucosaminephosphotransferase
LYLATTVVSQLLYAKTAVDQLQFNAAAFSICFMTLLGFCDDVIDLKWRYKLVLPFVAATPILVAYSGPTLIVVPMPFRELLGLTLELGALYKLYMALLSVFCTNSINIYAGVNGLEVGQSIVIGCAALTHNFIVRLT